jgi:hypothetical protein
VKKTRLICTEREYRLESRVGNLAERNGFEDLDVNGRSISKIMFVKNNGVDVLLMALAISALALMCLLLRYELVQTP